MGNDFLHKLMLTHSQIFLKAELTLRFTKTEEGCCILKPVEAENRYGTMFVDVFVLPFSHIAEIG